MTTPRRSSSSGPTSVSSHSSGRPSPPRSTATTRAWTPPSRGTSTPTGSGFLDTDSDDLVFHVSQAFFPRTGAWENLKRALKGTYEDSVWEHLAGTVSEPFAAGEHRKVAVKVIDDRGNELMVVKSLDEAVPER